MRWKETDKEKMWVMLHGDRSIRYATTLGAFRHGNMVDQNGVFHYIEKMYYQTSRKSLSGYILVHEGGGSVALSQNDNSISTDSQTQAVFFHALKRKEN